MREFGLGEESQIELDRSVEGREGSSLRPTAAAEVVGAGRSTAANTPAIAVAGAMGNRDRGERVRESVTDGWGRVS